MSQYLLLPFAAAGIALIVFLSIFRLTVATRMINSAMLTLCRSTEVSGKISIIIDDSIHRLDEPVSMMG